MINLGTKKKESQPRVESPPEELPQLTNEMQLIIMNKVKSGELSIDDAVNRARIDRQQLRQKSITDEEPSQYNFSVHKSGRYRWQKRLLQIDFKTRMLCNIEKGIIKRQFPFFVVKSCDDGVGSRFSISFKGHHDYELEAMSLEDKHQIMRLVNQIIYGNIYQDPEGDDTKTHSQPSVAPSLREGVLLLHRGGLASLKWVKYEAQLHPGQLTLHRRRPPSDVELTTAASAPIVIHLSHGDTTVQKNSSLGTFTLITHKHEYQFKVPLSDQSAAPGGLQKERDSWVRAIHTLCRDWKRKSMGEHFLLEPTALLEINIEEDTEDKSTEEESSDAAISHPPSDNPFSTERNPLSPTDLPPPPPKPPSSPPSAADNRVLTPVSSPTSPFADASNPSDDPPTSPGLPPNLASSSSSFSEMRKPPLPLIPAPPPLPFKLIKPFKKPRTKAFHWDLVASDKIGKSFWKQENSKRIVIDKTRLFEQFAVKAVGSFVAAEPSNSQHILLNEKIAHNFNIFLKSFAVQPGELKEKLYVIREEDGGLSDEQITSLRRYVPTLEDVEIFKSHKGPVSELHIVDQYMMAMCNIPYLSTQLDLLLTLRELPTSMNDLQPLINQKIRMCTQLYNCRSFVSVLEYLLAIGNYLNENAGKEKAKGFRLSSLTKISQLRGSDRKSTLLHALVEQVMLHEPCLATFTQELAEFETVPGASVKGLTAEVDVLKNELQKVIQYKKMSKKRSAEAPPPTFNKDLKVVINKHTTNLSALIRTCEEMRKLYSVILVKFGEASDQDSQELFGKICQFIQEFRKTKAEII